MLLTLIKNLILMSLFIMQLAHGFPLKADEEVMFFPTSAQQKANGLCEIPIHAWIYEPEKGSLFRDFGIKVIGEIMKNAGISEEQTESKLFHDRVAWFLVDNKRNKKLEVLIGNHPYFLSKTKANGHSHTSITTSCSTEKDYWFSLTLKTTSEDKRQFRGEVQLIPESGLSVISDIDDTIKISNVLDKKKLIRNTFAEPFIASPGMPTLYKNLKDKGAYFHYVSASPWQLYPSLKGFMETHYPKGSISLRQFRVKDSSLIDFFKPSKDYKLKEIRAIIQRYPMHQFILIGDNGEHDPEVYRTIADEFPNNIQSVYIRDVIDSSQHKKHRTETETKKVIRDKRIINTNWKEWKVFQHPNELGSGGKHYHP